MVTAQLGQTCFQVDFQCFTGNFAFYSPNTYRLGCRGEWRGLSGIVGISTMVSAQVSFLEIHQIKLNWISLATGNFGESG
jgi:hypothetical protein